MPDAPQALKSASVIQRHPSNPILSPHDVPYSSSLVFNAGVTKYQGRYVMVFRNDIFTEDHKYQDTNLGLAFSDDGVTWEVEPEPCFSLRDAEIERVYDPRLTVIDGRCAMCFAVDTRHGLRGGIALTEDFGDFQIQSLSLPDNRNMALFPEKIGGHYVRLERPFPVYSRVHTIPGGNPYRCNFDCWISDSPDLKYWGNSELLLAVEDVPFANDKIGPAAPPVRTRAGWLTAFHAVDIDDSRGKNGWEAAWKKRYSAGIMLLDISDPRKIVGISRSPLIAPEAEYEVSGGYRNNVIFPGGMVLEDSGEVKIYYGAADAVECLATADVEDLIALCKPL